VGGGVDAGQQDGGDGSAAGCSINSDCNSPFVCAFKRCHTQCQGTVNCPAGARCVHARDVDTGVLLGNVCQLSDERACVNNSQCPATLVCGIDGQCRDLCDVDRDCVGNTQVCRVHTCADASELNAQGTLNQVIDGGTKPDGAPLREPDGG
jgi:hypothetical protein